MSGYNWLVGISRLAFKIKSKNYCLFAKTWMPFYWTFRGRNISQFWSKKLSLGQAWPLFVYFHPLLNTMTNIGSTKIKFKLKRHRWRAWNSNPGPQDGRRRLIHCAVSHILDYQNAGSTVVVVVVPQNLWYLFCTNVNILFFRATENCSFLLFWLYLPFTSYFAFKNTFHASTILRQKQFCLFFKLQDRW